MLEFTKEKPFNLLCGDSYEVLKTLPDNSIDSIVTDPPYGMVKGKQPNPRDVLASWLNDEDFQAKDGYLGSKWDGFVPSPKMWKLAMTKLKPGGHIIAFTSPKNHHYLTLGLAIGGLEIRETIYWCYSSGFPKSHSIEKNINKQMGIEFEKSKVSTFQTMNEDSKYNTSDEDNRNWFKQVGESHPEAAKWKDWGTALKPAVEPIVIARKPIKETSIAKNMMIHGVGGYNIGACRYGDEQKFPSNFIVTDDDLNNSVLGENMKYFYCSKASKKDRNAGLVDYKNTHPTVKPTELMAYLCRLITPKGGIILDPFNGSGSTGKAAMREGFNYIGVDLDQDYIDISKARIEFELNKDKK